VQVVSFISLFFFILFAHSIVELLIWIFHRTFLFFFLSSLLSWQILHCFFFFLVFVNYCSYTFFFFCYKHFVGISFSFLVYHLWLYIANSSGRTRGTDIPFNRLFVTSGFCKFKLPSKYWSSHSRSYSFASCHQHNHNIWVARHPSLMLLHPVTKITQSFFPAPNTKVKRTKTI